MDYVMVKSKAVKGAARYTGIENYSNSFKLKQGVALRDEFPTDARLSMDPATPNDIALADCLHGAGSVLVVNGKTAELFAATLKGSIELLPIQVFNHKGKKVSEQYHVVNLLQHVDCIDVEKCEGIEWNDINPDAISGVQKLAIKPQNIPAAAKLFRPKQMTTQMLMHRSLADKIEAEGLKGFRFTEIDEFSYP